MPKFTSLNQICTRIGSKYLNDSEYIANDILNMFNNDKIMNWKNTNDGNVFSWIATYYKYKNNTDKMIEFDNKGIEKNSINSMINLGSYYFQNNEFSKANKYWTMAHNLNSYHAKYNLSLLYLLQGDVLLAKKLLEECILAGVLVEESNEMLNMIK